MCISAWVRQSSITQNTICFSNVENCIRTLISLKQWKCSRHHILKDPLRCNYSPQLFSPLHNTHGVGSGWHCLILLPSRFPLTLPLLPSPLSNSLSHCACAPTVLVLVLWSPALGNSLVQLLFRAKYTTRVIPSVSCRHRLIIIWMF